MAKPDYPVDMRKQGKQGRVILKALIDSNGKPSQISVHQSSGHTELDVAAMVALRASNFFPLTKNNVAVSASVLVPYQFSVENSISPIADLILQTEIKRQPKIAYPKELVSSGDNGLVVVKLHFDQDLKVRDPSIMKSSHPLFEKAVVGGLMNWRLDSQKFYASVPDSMIVAFQFTFKQEFGEVLPFQSKNSFQPLAQMPTDISTEINYGQAPKTKLETGIVYPYSLLKDSKSGKSKVSVLVGPNGKVQEVKVLETSHLEFGLATKAMMESWQFEPLIKDHKPTWAYFLKEQVFEPKSGNAYINDSTTDLLKKISNTDSGITPINKLDAPPKSLYRPEPVYPPTLYRESVSGKVKVGFFIDRDGSVQLPYVIEAENQELAWAAMTAIARWQFEPPMLSGQPTITHAEIPIKFEARAKAPTLEKNASEINAQAGVLALPPP